TCGSPAFTARAVWRSVVTPGRAAGLNAIPAGSACSEFGGSCPANTTTCIFSARPPPATPPAPRLVHAWRDLEDSLWTLESTALHKTFAGNRQRIERRGPVAGTVFDMTLHSGG